MASDTLKDLVATIGLAASLEITRAFGGRTMRIPIKPNETHPLIVTIGKAAALKLCAEYGGVHVEVPTERTALLAQRNALICADVRGGAKILTTARRYGLSPKMVRNILVKNANGNSPTL